MARGVSETRKRRRKKLALLWLAILAALTLLHWIADIGPLAWAATWFAVWTGRLLGGDILFLLLFLSLPALWFLVEPAGEESKTRRRKTAPSRDELKLAATIAVALVGVCLAVSAYAGVQMARLPGGEGPVTKPAGTLAGMAAAGQRLTFTGAPIEGTEVGFVQPARGSSSRWTYAGFRPGARRGTAEVRPPAGTPIALFVERRLNNVPNSPGYVPPAQEEMTGFLVADALPDHARIALERQGVTIARPHYVLKTAREGLREPWYVPLALGLFFAFAFGVIGLTLLVRAAAQGRKGG